MRLLLHALVISVLTLISAIQAAPVSGLSMIHPDTKQHIVIFGELHEYDTTQEETARTDVHLERLTEILQYLYERDYRIYYEPNCLASSSFNEKICTKSWYKKYEESAPKPTAGILLRISQIEKTFNALYTHYSERPGLVNAFLMFAYFAQEPINIQSTELHEIKKDLIEYLAIELPNFRTHLVSLQHVQHMSAVSKFLEILNNLINAIENNIDPNDWFKNPTDLYTFIGAMADITTLNHILNSTTNAVVYVGAAHVPALQQWLLDYGFEQDNQISTVIWQNFQEMGGLSSNNLEHIEFIKQFLFSLLNYQDPEQLRAITLFARIIVNPAHIAAIYDYSINRLSIRDEGIIDFLDNVNPKLDKVAIAANEFGRFFLEKFLIIDPVRFIHNPSRTLGAAQEEFLAQPPVASEELENLRSMLKGALDNVEFVYDTVPGLSNSN